MSASASPRPARGQPRLSVRPRRGPGPRPGAARRQDAPFRTSLAPARACRWRRWPRARFEQDGVEGVANIRELTDWHVERRVDAAVLRGLVRRARLGHVPRGRRAHPVVVASTSCCRTSTARWTRRAAPRSLAGRRPASSARAAREQAAAATRRSARRALWLPRATARWTPQAALVAYVRTGVCSCKPTTRTATDFLSRARK